MFERDLAHPGIYIHIYKLIKFSYSELRSNFSLKLKKRTDINYLIYLMVKNSKKYYKLVPTK